MCVGVVTPPPGICGDGAHSSWRDSPPPTLHPSPPLPCRGTGVKEYPLRSPARDGSQPLPLPTPPRGAAGTPLLLDVRGTRAPPPPLAPALTSLPLPLVLQLLLLLLHAEGLLPRHGPDQSPGPLLRRDPAASTDYTLHGQPPPQGPGTLEGAGLEGDVSGRARPICPSSPLEEGRGRWNSHFPLGARQDDVG